MTNNSSIIGIDLGGTNIRAGLVSNNKISKLTSCSTPKTTSDVDVLNEIARLVAELLPNKPQAIGIGVPSVVDTQNGIVYEVENIPSWKEVHLKSFLENQFGIPVFVNNDANCFATGEKHFGKGMNADSFVALTLGTGLGAGIIVNNRLYEGHNCGAGEICSLPYLQHNYEYYCSGLFFRDEYELSASEAAKKAMLGEPTAIEMFTQFGFHMGQLLQAVLYTFDPEMIVLGGSVAKSYPLFESAMMKQLQQFKFPKTLERLSIEVSELDNSAIYGAASLYCNNQQK